MASDKDRRKSERVETPSIPVQISEINGEMIDLSFHGAAIIHRSPIKAGAAVTLIFPSYGGIYVPAQVLRSVVQVRRTASGPEYIFRSAISFLPMTSKEQDPLREFLQLQMDRLRKLQEESAAMDSGE